MSESRASVAPDDCFACGRAMKRPEFVFTQDTRSDGKHYEVHVGPECFKHVQAAGETQTGLLDVLVEAMSQREGVVMHGVPWQLVWDAGSANMAHSVQNLLRALGVRQWPHLLQPQGPLDSIMEDWLVNSRMVLGLHSSTPPAAQQA